METGEDLYLKQAVVNYKNMYNINSYEYKGHVEYIRDIKSYYNANMNLLNNEVFNELFLKSSFLKERCQGYGCGYSKKNR